MAEYSQTQERSGYLAHDGLQPVEGREITLRCRDGVTLRGHVWSGRADPLCGTVIVNPATGVRARYYHYFARFLAEHGFVVLTYDYRGIGLSRPDRLAGCGFRWRDWGERDFDAALDFADRIGGGPVLVVGHSIGGFLPGFAANARRIDRMLTVGAQYAYWRDYAARERLRLFLKWHLAMPALTALFGYFPGERLGWLEDLPAGVANEWSFRRARMELSYPARERQAILNNFSAVTAPILAITAADDEFATVTAIRRALRYYRQAPTTEVLLSPANLGVDRLGHFDLFHARHATGFWIDALLWLRDGINPWPDKAPL
ncbi:putative alpha/beta hydrolase [Ciceribacter lividus]|uniref:Putative alpha/beta hydrolase n=1 Tax=Ciceribacter lividus TaxID=1197950 RepID=A0A6I7HQ85_9HYPH|nr:alpha/beta fold hydrolase [Ciceribacter lividus]RCW27191.1 putative alpha/beta hydrolase [Ciceribacter lividus]